MFCPVHISRARCCRDDAGLRVSHIYVVCASPGGCGVRRVECALSSSSEIYKPASMWHRMRCTQSRVCEACGRAVAAPWRGGAGGRGHGTAAAGMAAPRRGGGRADRGGPGLGREREMPDAARAAALSRRAYEAATGRGLGGVGTVSPVKRLRAWGLCGCGAGPVCALWAVEGHGGALVPHRDPRRAEPNGFWVTVYRYPSIVLWADVPEGRTTEVVER
jgi:hypothetical protein